jgi:uncharacterized protein YgiM (DUF1202 family)
MSKGGIMVLIMACLVFSGLGFVFGRVVTEASNVPSEVVSKSWVQLYVGDMMAEIQEKLDNLEMQNLDVSSDSPDTSIIPEPLNNPTTPTPNPNPAPKQPTSVRVKSTNTSVNIREDASANASIVGSAESNAVLTYLGQKNDSEGQAWYHVRLADGSEGWVAGWLCNDPE